MTLYCAVCDDYPEAVELARASLEQTLEQENVTCEITEYTCSRRLLFDIDKSKPLDILILDIEMPLVTGIEIAKAAKKVYENCLIIFLTEHLKYAVEGYELEVFRFIPKEEVNTRLPRAIKDAVSVIRDKDKRSYLVCRHDLFEKVYYNDILYIKKDGKKSVIHLLNGHTVNVRKPLSEIYEELNSEEFIFVDRGCIANMSNVVKLDHCDWTCKNGETIMVSHSSYNEIRHKLLNFWGREA